MNKRVLVILLVCILRGGPAMSDEMLFDFEKDFSVAAVETHDTKVSVSPSRDGVALRIESYHKEEWPGIVLKAPGGKWDLSSRERIVLEVKNVGANAVTVSCRVDNPGADGSKNSITGSITLSPGQAGTIAVPFKRKPVLGGVELKFNGMRGFPVGAPGENTIDPSNIVQLIIFVGQPKEDHVFEIDNVRAAGEYAVPKVDPAMFFPFIDMFGQYKHKDWPGKVHSVEELRARIDEESKDIAQKPTPSDWDEYGGLAKGPTLKTTGFFHPEKYKGKWWLVDPKGKLFFSHGIDCVGAFGWGATPIEDRNNWFEGLPAQDSEFKMFFSRHNCIIGDFKGRQPMCFDFIGANLFRKHGPEWQKKAAEMSHARLRSWGMNTIANWSDPATYLMHKTPYVVSVHFGGKEIEGSEGYWGKFKDVFDPDFKQQLQKSLAREKGKSAGDPWCIGYFVDNEISWGDETSLPLAVLASSSTQVAKQAFVEDLKAKYETIGRLNGKWGTDYVSWDALLESRTAPDKNKAADDFRAFYVRIAEQYFKICKEAVKEIAPNNLYLGCRFAWVNDSAAKAAAKYCDVVSYNLYFRRSVADFKYPGGDVPLIIGEFHFGALDRGMFHGGLGYAENQADRVAAYKEYVTSVLNHTQFVGCHWFQYRDEPTTGRPLDGENYQCGFVDIADTPYAETVTACREIGYNMYKMRLGVGEKKGK
jgi:hypothetical protein